MAEGPSESELSNAIRLDQSLAAVKIPVARWQRKALETSCNNSSLNGTSSGEKFLYPLCLITFKCSGNNGCNNWFVSSNFNQGYYDLIS